MKKSQGNNSSNNQDIFLKEKINIISKELEEMFISI